MAITGIDLKCDETSRFQYISFGDVLGCSGSASFSAAERVRFTYSIEEILDGIIQVRSIRVVGDSGGSTRMEAFTASPTPLPAFPQSLESPESDLLSDPPGFFEVQDAAGTVTLDSAPSMEDLDANAAVSGVFELNGGIVSNLGQAVEDPGTRVFGCFFGPSEAHPIELD